MKRLKPYPEYKSSGIEWTVDIPSSWKTVRTGYVYDITLGKMIQTEKKKSTDKLVPYLKANNVQDNFIDFGTVDYMYASENEIEKYKLKVRDLLVCEGGEVAQSAFMDKNLNNCIFQNALHRVRSTENGNLVYLHYLLNVIRHNGFINILVNRATIAHFTRDKFSSLRIPLPSSYEQKKISNYLAAKTSQIDALISDKERLIELLEEKRQAVITETVTKGLDPNVKMKDSGIEWIGEIPEHWETTKIKYTTYVKGRIGWQGLRSDEFTDIGPHLVTGTDFQEGIVNWSTCYRISEERYEEAPDIQLKNDDLLITKDGTIGKTAIVKDKPQKAILNSGVFVTRPYKEEYLTEYLYWVLNSSVFIDYIDIMSSGTTVRHLYQETFNNFIYPLPNLKEQKMVSELISTKVSQLNNIIDETKLQISKLKEYRESLIYEAVTGKIDVRNYATTKEEVY